MKHNTILSILYYFRIEDVFSGSLTNGTEQYLPEELEGKVLFK